MRSLIGPGMRVPQVGLARLDGDTVETVLSDQLLARRRAVVIGIVGAFTPVCTSAHIPEFVDRADDLRRLGFDRVICVVPNDPWTMIAWSRLVDPENKILFVSDGNLSLARSLGLTFEGTGMFLGERSRRYMMLVKDGIVERLTVELIPTELACTRARDVVRQDLAA